MNASTKMTIDVSGNLGAKLDRLADNTHRTPAALVTEAVTAYVERELEIIDGIHRGLADMAACRTISHDQVTARARRIVEDARRARG